MNYKKYISINLSNLLLNFRKKILKSEKSRATFLAAVFFLLSFGFYSEASVASPITLPFKYDFRSDGTLVEAKSENLSSSPYWWFQSGAKLIIQDGKADSLSQKLPPNDV